MLNGVDKNIEFLLTNVLVKHKRSELEILKFSKNQPIISESTLIEHIYFLVGGKIKVYKEYENGKTLLLQFVDGLSSMGDVEYINEINIATGSVKAVNDVYLFKLTFDELSEKYSTCREFNNYLIKHLSKRFLTSNGKTGLNLIYSVETRLASYILSMNNKISENIVILENLQDLSNNLGTSYRHLHRSLKDLSDKKAIQRVKNKITILDLNKLKELARGNIYEDSYSESET